MSHKAPTDLQRGTGLNEPPKTGWLQTFVIQNEAVAALCDVINAAFATSKATTAPAKTSNVRLANWDRNGVSSEAWLDLMPFHESAGACSNTDGFVDVDVDVNHAGGWNNVATLIPQARD